MDVLLQDLRYAVRSLIRTPSFTVVALLALALGIAANTAIFSVVNGVLLRPLPYADADRVVMLWTHWENWPATWISEPEFADYRAQMTSFASVAAFQQRERNLTGSGAPERINVTAATASIWPTLGVQPVRGRVFTAAEDQPGTSHVAVISDGLWERRFGRDASVIGRTILLNDSSYTVVGVMPAGFQLPLDFTEPSDLWLPLGLGPVNPTDRGGHWMNVVARLKPGVSVARAQNELDALWSRLRNEYADSYTKAYGATLVPVSSQVLGDVRPALLLLLGAVGFVLLIACANVANLLLARAELRQREIAVRTAIGAPRSRVLRQLLTESGALALAGGALGLVLAAAMLRAIVAIAPSSIPRIADVGIDAKVLAFTLVLSLGTGALFGLAPALHGARADLQSALRGSGRGASAGAHRLALRRALIVGEIALSLVLVIGASLLIQSFARLRRVDPGFDPANVLTLQVALPPASYPRGADVRQFYRTLLDRTREIPGVRAAGAIRQLPMTGTIGDWGFRIQGRAPADPRNEYQPGDWQIVAPDYFTAMRIPLVAGRFLTEDDDARAPGAILFNETLAKRAFGSAREAVGQRVMMGGDTTWRTIVGVVGDVRHRGLSADARPELYLPHAQWPTNEQGPIGRAMTLVLRTTRDPLSVVPAVRAQVRALDANVPVSHVRTMDDVLGTWAAERRLTMLVLSVLAGTAMALAAIGIYGVMAYVVAQRTHEIGVRVALGARPRDVVGMVVRQGASLALIGVGAGVVAALALTGLMSKLLFGIAPRDPITFAAIALLLSATAVVATWIPARRAAGVAPTEALRSE